MGQDKGAGFSERGADTLDGLFNNVRLNYHPIAAGAFHRANKWLIIHR